MGFNLTKARLETPGCEHVLHFNNAGASLLPKPVYDAVTQHLEQELLTGGYEAQDAASEKIENTYLAVSKLLGCTSKEIAIVENATNAWDMAFYSIPFQPGDRILTSMTEYCSNYIAFLQVSQKTGATIEVIPNDEYGQTSVSALRNMLDDRVKLIAVNHIPTNSGLINPVAEIGQVAREANILYLLDACQSAGQVPLSVKEIGCDFLTATGRKYLRGPRGTGFLYVREELITKLEPPFLDCHSAEWIEPTKYIIRADARRFENWESNQATKIGLGVAVDYLLEIGVEETTARIVHLADLLRQQLNRITGVEVTDIGKNRGGIVTFSCLTMDARQVKQALSEVKINVQLIGPSSARLDMEQRKLGLLIRASVHYYNSEEEIVRFAATLESIVKK